MVKIRNLSTGVAPRAGFPWSRRHRPRGSSDQAGITGRGPQGGHGTSSMDLPTDWSVGGWPKSPVVLATLAGSQFQIPSWVVSQSSRANLAPSVFTMAKQSPGCWLAGEACAERPPPDHDVVLMPA